MKKQKYLIGGIIKIVLNNDQIVLGKILQKGDIVVYKKVGENSEKIQDIYSYIESGPLVFGYVFDRVITNAEFEIIDCLPVSNLELQEIPPQYSMETDHPELCKIMYGDGICKKALPSECIGMDYQFIWDGASFIELIEDRLAGRPNKYEELERKDFEIGLEIEKTRGMKEPWEGWNFL